MKCGATHTLAKYGMDLRLNVIALPVHFHESALGPEALDLPAWRTLGLVADEQHIMPLVTQHRF